MHKDLPGSGRKHAFLRAAAGLALGVPVTAAMIGIGGNSTQAAGPELPTSAAPIQQAAATTDATSVSTPAHPQFQSQQYQNEVERQLQLLYQQNPQSAAASDAPQRPMTPPPGGVRKMRMKDWLNQSAWKRQYHR